MLRIFDRDLNTKVYNEASELSGNDRSEKLRLNSLSEVKSVIDKDRAPLIVLKPLVETQNSVKLLDYFEDSAALWIYRSYKDTAFSFVRFFGSDLISDWLRTIIEDKSDVWTSEHVPEKVRKIVLRYFSEEMPPYDAAALFWFVRNSFFFELNLNLHPSVIMTKYEDLVTNPSEMMQRIYDFTGHDFPGKQILREVRPVSMGKGKHISLSPHIDCLCQDLLVKLNQAYQTKIRENTR